MFVFGLLVFAVGLSTPAAAAPPEINQRIDIPAFGFFDPCTNEFFVGSGTIHLILKTSSSADVTRFDVHVVSRARGTSLLTGTRFTLIQNQNAHGTFSSTFPFFPFSVDAVTIVRVIGQGNAPDFRLHIVAQIAVDANGQPTLVDVKRNTTCSGGPLPQG